MKSKSISSLALAKTFELEGNRPKFGDLIAAIRRLQRDGCYGDGDTETICHAFFDMLNHPLDAQQTLESISLELNKESE